MCEATNNLSIEELDVRSLDLCVWLFCRWRGYTVAVWAAPLAISAFCLGLFVGAENATRGKFRVPILSSHYTHRPHLAHH